MEPIAVTAHQAGELLGISADTVRRLVEAGHLPRVPHIGIIRIPLTSLRAFAEGQVAA